jgi:CDGSH-type Zn-finger protein
VQGIVQDSDGYPYQWRLEKTYPPQQNYALCRCGRSQNKPFCDGAHRQAGFDGAETASRAPFLEQAEHVLGPAIELTDVRALCAGAAFCVRAGGIRKLVQQSDDPEARRLAIEEAELCPAGRLVVWDAEGDALEPALEPSIVMVQEGEPGASGPIWVRGGIPIEAEDGTVYEVRNRVTLCSCGRSQNKPFCDGEHHAE